MLVVPKLPRIIDALAPLMVNRLAPGPAIVISLGATNGVVSVIVAGSGTLNVIVSPFAALAMACLSDPGPLSFVFVTVRTEKAFARRVPTPGLNIPSATMTISKPACPNLMSLDLFIFPP